MIRLPASHLLSVALCATPSLALATVTEVEHDAADLIVEAPTNGEKLGMATHIADLDGDGYDDILFSATDKQVGIHDMAGEVYVYFGPISDYNTEYHPEGEDLGDPDITISGIADSQGVGTQIETGDINDDGDLDVVISARTAYDTGETYVFLGPVVLGTDLQSTDADVRLQGDASGDLFGHELVVADLDGDGYDDVAVSAPNAPSHGGEVYIYWGDSGWGASSPLSPDVTFSGHGSIETGTGLSAGYIQAGNPALAIGSPGADSARGKVHLFIYDSSAPWTDDSIDGGQADLVLYCRDLHSASCGFWGTHIDFVGDVVGDTSGSTDLYSELMVHNVTYEGLDILESSELASLLGTTTAPVDSVYIKFNTGFTAASMRGDSAGVMTRGDVGPDLLFSHAAYSNVPSTSYGYVAMYPVPTSGLTYGDYYSGPTGTGDQVEFYGYESVSGSTTVDSAFGTSFAVGDVNGDGVGDLLVGAPGGDLDSSVHLFYGPFTPLEGEFDLGDADVYFDGENAWDTSGLVVSTAGDLNCDGIPDVAVTAPLAAASTTRTGAVYFFFGPDSASRQSSNSTLTEGWLLPYGLEEADAVFWGEAAGDLAGYAFAAVGDTDDDGCDDVLIGAPLNDDGGTDAGAAYLLLGSSSLSGDFDDTDAAEEYHGTSGDHLGSAVAGLGDLNSDDHAEYAIGSPLWDTTKTDAGLVLLVDGQTGCEKAYVGNADDQLLGWSLVGPIDFDGSGTNDLLMGAPGHSSYLTEGGAVFPFPDPTPCTSTSPTPTSVSTAFGIFLGRAEGGQFGYSMAVAPAESGADALVVGAPYAYESVTYPGQEDGEAHWIPGQTIGGTAIAPAGGVPIGVDASLSNLGMSVGAGDVTGDGYADVLVGAPQWDSDSTLVNNGATFVLDGATVASLAPYSGFALDAKDNAQIVLTGEDAQDRSGQGSSIVGDLNQDGEQDIFVGATWSDTGGYMSGSSYIFLSSHIDP